MKLLFLFINSKREVSSSYHKPAAEQTYNFSATETDDVSSFKSFIVSISGIIMSNYVLFIEYYLNTSFIVEKICMYNEKLSVSSLKTLKETFSVAVFGIRLDGTSSFLSTNSM